MRYHSLDSAFTLIELLVVIAIIAILAVVVVLTLNPAELLRQSRDADRVSDMATLTSAINLYSADQSGAPSYSLGTPSTTYFSFYDPAATSSVGTNCATAGLFQQPYGWSYQCPASSTLRNVNNTGWIPVNFSGISSGSPFGALPIDPSDSSSSHLYYTYTTNGSTYELAAAMESQKYQFDGANDVESNDGGANAYLLEKGTNLSLEPIDYGLSSGLTGYWPLNEGTSTVAYDFSGNNATGSWQGSAVGASGYYSLAANQIWAGAFDGSSTYINEGAWSSDQTTYTITMWFKANSVVTSYQLLFRGSSSGCFYDPSITVGGGNVNFSESGCSFSGFIGSFPVSAGQWYQMALVRSGTNATIYLNGVQGASTSSLPLTWSVPGGAKFLIGASWNGTATSNSFNGLIDNVRVYNIALTSAQVAALYTAGR